jgi:hypothetical protein
MQKAEQPSKKLPTLISAQDVTTINEHSNYWNDSIVNVGTAKSDKRMHGAHWHRDMAYRNELQHRRATVNASLGKSGVLSAVEPGLGSAANR